MYCSQLYIYIYICLLLLLLLVDSAVEKFCLQLEILKILFSCDRCDDEYWLVMEWMQVGAPPEIASLLDEIRRENELCHKRDVVSTCFGADPELDEFMVPPFPSLPSGFFSLSYVHTAHAHPYIYIYVEPIFYFCHTDHVCDFRFFFCLHPSWYIIIIKDWDGWLLYV